MGFIDDEPTKLAEKEFVVHARSILAHFPTAYLLAVPGSPVSFNKRAEYIGSFGLPDERFVSIVHPKANIGKSVKMGTNCLVMAGVVITSNAIIGDHVCILPNTVVHHDAKIGPYTMIGSNVAVAGGTSIGKNCYIGSGSNIINGINIGDGVLVGLGSNVIKDVPAHSIVAGNPARQLRKTDADA